MLLAYSIDKIWGSLATHSAPTMGARDKLPLLPPPLADLDAALILVRFLTSSVFVSHKRVDNIPILYEYLTKWYKWGA